MLPLDAPGVPQGGVPSSLRITALHKVLNRSEKC